MVFGLPRPILCLIQSRSTADCETARELFLIIFQTKRLYLSSSCFSDLFNASARLFCPLSFAQSRKILSKFSKLSAILKHGGKNFVTMMSIVRLSSNRSQARTNQNARITWVVILNSIETRRTCFLFLLENTATRKRKTTC